MPVVVFVIFPVIVTLELILSVVPAPTVTLLLIVLAPVPENVMLAVPEVSKA